MKEFTVKRPNHSDYTISGPDLKEAIARNFKTIANNASIGNAAGYKLVDLFCVYKQGILGGRGGVELTIFWRGRDLAHMTDSDGLQTSTVWILAESQDMPEPYEFLIERNNTPSEKGHTRL